MEELKELKKLINKARHHAIQESDLIYRIFQILNEMGINTEVPTNAENADNLGEAITCHITYGEYNVDSIIKEIKKEIGK